MASVKECFDNVESANNKRDMGDSTENYFSLVESHQEQERDGENTLEGVMGCILIGVFGLRLAIGTAQSLGIGSTFIEFFRYPFHLECSLSLW